MNTADIEKLKRAIPLWQIAQERLPDLKRQGSEYLAKCPFHDDSTPSFRIYEKDGLWLFKCFGCSENGNAIQFIQKFDQITFPEAVEKLKILAGWQDLKNHVERTFREPLQEAPKVTFPLARFQEAEDALAKSPIALAWLADRGITLETAQKMHIGFNQSCAAVNNKHPWASDGWMVFPSLVADVITLLKYRSVKGKKTENGESAILRKRNMDTPLYNINTIEPFDDVFIVEGEPDAAIMEQASFRTVAYPNSSFTPRPHERDRLMTANRRFLAGDMDEPGIAAMEKLGKELEGGTFRIEWPKPCKDANETFLKVCGGDVEKFKTLVEQLKNSALSKPLDFFYDMRETLKNVDRTNPMEDPKRLHFPWPKVDMMACCRPGAVVSSYATLTGSGKTTFWLSVCLKEAIEHGSVVVNYSGELSQDEIAQLTTAILTRKDRLKLTDDDFKIAAIRLADARFYVGFNPDVTRVKDILGDEKNLGLLEGAVKRLGANIVVLDHLHFFTANEGQNATSAEAAAMTRIKSLAVKYNLIFIVVGQSRKAQQGSAAGKVSEHSDAKGSEAFLSTANTAYHLHRNIRKDIDPKNPPQDLLDPLTAVRLYKCRTKGPGSAYVQLWFEGANGRFTETIPNAAVPPQLANDEEDYGQFD